jgi:hypothetical protein
MTRCFVISALFRNSVTQSGAKSLHKLRNSYKFSCADPSGVAFYKKLDRLPTRGDDS